MLSKMDCCCWSAAVGAGVREFIVLCRDDCAPATIPLAWEVFGAGGAGRVTGVAGFRFVLLTELKFGWVAAWSMLACCVGEFPCCPAVAAAKVSPAGAGLELEAVMGAASILWVS